MSVDRANLLRYRIKALYVELESYGGREGHYENKPTRTEIMKEIERLKTEYYRLTNSAWFNHGKKES